LYKNADVFKLLSLVTWCSCLAVLGARWGRGV